MKKQISKYQKVSQLPNYIAYRATLKFPGPNSTFESILQNEELFIDKTMYIKDLMTQQKWLYFFVKPPGSGKSVNSDMALHYLSKNFGQNQKVQSFQKFFEKLMVGTEEQFRQKNFRKHYGIKIDFRLKISEVCDSSTYQVKKKIVQFFLRNFQVQSRQNQMLSKVFKQIQKLIQFKNQIVNFNTQISSKICELVSILYSTIEKSKIFLLVLDHIDFIPICHHVYKNIQQSQSVATLIKEIIQKIIINLKNKESNVKIVINCTYNCFSSQFFGNMSYSGTNQLFKNWSCYFGTQKDEVKTILGKMRISESQAEILDDLIQRWYGGYFQKNICLKNQELSIIGYCNTSSVITYFKKCEQSSNFVNFEASECSQLQRQFMQKIAKQQFKITQLEFQKYVLQIESTARVNNLSNDYTTLTLFYPTKDFEKPLNLLDAISRFTQKQKNVNDLDCIKEMFLVFAINKGILSGTLNNFGRFVGYIPNKQSATWFQNYVRKLLLENKIITNFTYFDIQNRQQTFNRYKQVFLNYRKIYKSRNEHNIYVLTALAYGFSKYHTHHQYVQQNIQKGGRLDSVYLPCEAICKTAVVVEYKFVHSEKQMQRALEEGFKQIYTQIYMQFVIDNAKDSADFILNRCAVVFFGETATDIKLQFKQKRHNLKQAKIILQFFTHQTVKDKLKQNTLHVCYRCMGINCFEELIQKLNDFKDIFEVIQFVEEMVKKFEKLKKEHQLTNFNLIFKQRPKIREIWKFVQNKDPEREIKRLFTLQSDVISDALKYLNKVENVSERDIFNVHKDLAQIQNDKKYLINQPEQIFIIQGQLGTKKSKKNLNPFEE